MAKIGVYNPEDGFYYYEERIPESSRKINGYVIGFYYKKDWDGKQRFIGYDLRSGVCISSMADMMGRDTEKEAVKEIKRIVTIFGDRLPEMIKKRRRAIRREKEVRSEDSTFIKLKLIGIL